MSLNSLTSTLIDMTINTITRQERAFWNRWTLGLDFGLRKRWTLDRYFNPKTQKNILIHVCSNFCVFLDRYFRKYPES